MSAVDELGELQRDPEQIERHLWNRLGAVTAQLDDSHTGDVLPASEARELVEAIQRLRALAPALAPAAPIDATQAVAVVWHAANDLGLPMPQVDHIAQSLSAHLRGEPSQRVTPQG